MKIDSRTAVCTAAALVAFAGNSVLTLQFCVNYGARAEIADADSDLSSLGA